MEPMNLHDDGKPARARFGLPLLVVVVSLVTLVLSLVILWGGWPALIPQWYTMPSGHSDVARWWPGVLCLLVYLAADRLLRYRTWPRVLWSLLGSLAVPVALLAPWGDPFYLLLTRTISPYATGAFTAGTQLTPAMVHQWSAIMPAWRDYLPHISIGSPGWPWVYSLAIGALTKLPGLSATLAAALRPLQCNNWNFNTLGDAQAASAWLGIASPLWAALTVFPMYWLGRRVAGREVALDAIAWWPLVPALTLFAGTPNTIYPLLATLVVALLWVGAAGPVSWRSVLQLLLAGCLTGLLVVLNFSLVPLLLLCGLVTLFQWHRGQTWLSAKAWLPPVWVGAQFGLGLLAVVVAYRLAAGHSLLSLLSIAMGVHYSMARPYLPGLWLHTWDFAIFVGLPLFVLSVVQVLACGRYLEHDGKVHRMQGTKRTKTSKREGTRSSPHEPSRSSCFVSLRFPSWLRVPEPLPRAQNAEPPLAVLACGCAAGDRDRPLSRLAAALGLTLLALVLSGTAEGEVGRVWLFFMPFVLLVAASALQGLRRSQRTLVVASQAVWLLALALMLRPVDTWLGLPPAYAQVAPEALSAATTPVDASFDGEMRLAGYQAEYRPASHSLVVALHWQALRPIATPYYFSGVLVTPEGQARPGVDWQPLGKQYPTTCWRPGATGGEVVDRVEFSLGSDPPPGNWWLSLSAFSMSHDRPSPPLRVSLPDGSQDKQVGLGPLPVTP